MYAKKKDSEKKRKGKKRKYGVMPFVVLWSDYHLIFPHKKSSGPF